MTTTMKLGDADNDWRAFDEVYEEFVDANPMLGLGSSIFAATRLRQHYGAALVEAGAAIKLPNRRWLAHAGKFGPALFAAMTGRRDEIIGQARTHHEGPAEDAAA
jgi:hypothetical protein